MTVRLARWPAGAAFARVLPAAWILFAAVPAFSQSLSRVDQQILDTLETRLDELPPDQSQLRLGLGPVVTSALGTHGREKVYLLPLVFANYKDIVALDETELRANFFPAASSIGALGLRAGPMFKVDFGRRAFGEGVTAPGKVGTSYEVGGYISFGTGPLRLRARVRQDVASGHGGAVAEFDARSGLYKNGNFSLGAQLASAWASRKYMQSFFGVTSAQAATSGMPVYTPGPGFKDVRVSLVGEYKLTAHWSSTFSLQYVRRVGDALHSPVVQNRGTANRLNTGIFALYTF